MAKCYSGGGNFEACIRDHLPGAPPSPAPVEQAKAAASVPAAQSAMTAVPAETAVDAPAVDATPPVTTATAPAAPATPTATPAVTPAPAAPSDLIAATFGLLRAQPDGSVVIAGSGRPGSEIAIFNNGALLGKTTVGASGDWVFVPDAPLPPGGAEITLGETGKTALADKSFVVVINPDKTSEPLVVASTPGAASDIVQGLTKPLAVASAEPAAPVAPAAAATPAAPAVIKAPEPAAVAAAPAVETPAAPVAAAAPALTAPATAEPTPAAAPTAASTAPEPAKPDVDIAAAAPAPAAPAPVDPAPAVAAATPSAAPATVAPAATPAQVAVAEPAEPTPPAVPDIVGVAPTIDAIEIDSGKSFFAGNGPEGASVRLYVDDSFIADSVVKDGRWLVEAGNVLTKPMQRVRIDVLKPNSSDVAARAEVNFEVDLPTAPPTAIAAAPEPAVPAAAAAPDAAAPATDMAVAAPDEPATSTDKPLAVAAAPATAPVTTTAPAAPEPVAPAGPTPPDTLAPPAPTPATVAAPAEPAVAAADPVLEAATDDAVPTLVATAVGDPEALRFASGKAIIRRGDNLWTIARRVYGSGIKYTAIYQANTAQIRNPDRIYPGQVFELPKSN